MIIFYDFELKKFFLLDNLNFQKINYTFNKLTINIKEDCCISWTTKITNYFFKNDFFFYNIDLIFFYNIDFFFINFIVL